MALKSLWLALSALARRVREAPALRVACDFDGTLVPIVDHPDEAMLPRRARTALDALVRDPAVQVAVLSGRTITDLESRTRLDRVFMTGIAGHEVRDPNDGRVLRLAPERIVPGEVRDEMRRWCARFAGAWLEDKGPAFALHYRAVPANRQPAFCAGVRRRLRRWAGNAVLVSNHKVFDVLPPPGWNQVEAMRRWLRGRGDGLLFFFGDDAADDPVHSLTRERQGVAVSVGNPHSHAEFLLSSTEDVIWALEWLGREWAQSEAHGARSPETP